MLTTAPRGVQMYYYLDILIYTFTLSQADTKPNGLVSAGLFYCL